MFGALKIAQRRRKRRRKRKRRPRLRRRRKPRQRTWKRKKKRRRNLRKKKRKSLKRYLMAGGRIKSYNISWLSSGSLRREYKQGETS
jgi:hypothetical protein